MEFKIKSTLRLCDVRWSEWYALDVVSTAKYLKARIGVAFLLYSLRNKNFFQGSAKQVLIAS